jgi:single-strand DNA-binding protein
MAGVNKAIILGNLGKDPETSYTRSGTAVTKFTVATLEKWNDKATGEKKERTEWHRVTAFGKLAEICGEYLSKGKTVYIEGRIQTDSYKKDGVKRYSTSIIASQMQMIGARGQEDRPQTPKPLPEPDPKFDEDIPF